MPFAKKRQLSASELIRRENEARRRLGKTPVSDEEKEQVEDTVEKQTLESEEEEVEREEIEGEDSVIGSDDAEADDSESFIGDEGTDLV